MQFISLNTNSYAFGYKTKPGFGWSTGLAVRLVFPLQGAADLLHELGHVSYRAAAEFEHHCAEPCNAKMSPCSCRPVLMASAGADPLSLSICLPPLPGLCVSGRGDRNCTDDAASNRGSTAQPPTQLWASLASSWGKQVAEAGNNSGGCNFIC